MIAVQAKKAFPVVFDGQLHIGMWLNTSHKAPCPHRLIHGLTHLLFTQVRLCAQSEL